MGSKINLRFQNELIDVKKMIEVVKEQQIKNEFFKIIFKIKPILGTSLVVQWLKLCASNARGPSSIPGQGTKIPHLAGHVVRPKINK